MNRLTETAPERIWLYEKYWTMSGHTEVAWSDKEGAGVAYVRADLLDTYIGNSEAAYASLSDKFKATQRDLNTANARIAELEQLNAELAKVAKVVLDECDQVSEQVAYIQVMVIEAAQKRMAELGLSAFELGA